MKYRYFVVVLFCCSTLWANVKIQPIFSDNMVLQRNSNAILWGTADPGEEVTVNASWGKEAKTKTNADGKWKLKLETPEAGGPFNITIKGNNTINLKNVMSGEVWVCGGQSNMDFTMGFFKDTKEAIKQADYPNIRLFMVAKTVSPEKKLSNVNGSWQVCSPKTVIHFSATGYFFGLNIYKALNIPVGLIHSAQGGTRIEAWIPWDKQKESKHLINYKKDVAEKAKKYDEAKETEIYAKSMKKYKIDYQNWLKNRKNGEEPKCPQMKRNPTKYLNYPSTLYNGMINPIAPYTIKGVIWYQGESNSSEPKEYENKLETLIASWRELWGQGDFPFYFVQLPSYYQKWSQPVEENAAWAILREQFAKVARNIPNTAMAITIDLGEENNIHPQQKSKVGERLARLALKKDYDKSDIVWTGPYFKSCKFTNGKAIIKFETGGSDLASRNGEELKGFALYSPKDTNFVFAKAKIISKDTIEVFSPQVSNPTLVYYAWAQNPQGANLINKAGLPASPFRYGKKSTINLMSLVLADKEKEYNLAYTIDPKNAQCANNTKFVYVVDNSEKLSKPFTKIAYFLGMKGKDSKIQYVFVEMDPFTKDIKKIGVPDKASGALFQLDITNVTVTSNVDGIHTGAYATGFNIEFWCGYYGAKNSKKIPSASDQLFDFGDSVLDSSKSGYGSMQIHNYAKKQSVICFNNFRSGSKADIGIGNSNNSKASDWTFSNNAQKWQYIELKVLVK